MSLITRENNFILLVWSFKDVPGYSRQEAQTSRVDSKGRCECQTCVCVSVEPVQQENEFKITHGD